jgi:hypothetical protein
MCCEVCGNSQSKLYCNWPSRLCDECAQERTDREKGVDYARFVLDRWEEMERANDELTTVSEDFDDWPSGETWDDNPAWDTPIELAPKRKWREPNQRMRQLMRVLLVIQLLAPLRKGATLSEIAKDVRDDVGAYCERTIKRDLEALEMCGLVDSVWEDSDTHNRVPRKRYVWCDRSFKTAMFSSASERMGALA